MIVRLRSVAGAWLACAALLGLSISLFGIAPSGPGLIYIGYGADPEQFIWVLHWFPFAWRHGLDFLHTSFVGAPTGISLAWHTSIPSLGLLAAPFTLGHGALATYNGLMRTAPGLAGIGAFWAAREITGRTLPAFVAGLVFGFSAYEMGQSLGHLNLSFTLAVPLLVWALLRAARRGWPPGLLAAVGGTLFAFEFGVSQEISASFLVLGALAAGWAWLRDPDLRPALRSLAPGILAGLAVAFVLSSPLLFAMLFGGARSDTSIASPSEVSTDLLNFVVPTSITWTLNQGLLGRWAAALADRFPGNASEDAGYVGLPLIVLLAWILRRHPDRTIRLPLELGALAAILSIGPLLHVAGRAILPAPWGLLSWLPFLHDMLPARFMLYAWLALSLGLAAWLAQPRPWPVAAGRFALVAGACAFCVPNRAQVAHWTRLPIPSIFLAKGDDAIPAGSRVFIMPFVGDHIGAQYASGMRFALVAQGYLGGGIARPFSNWPLMGPLFDNRFDAVDPREFAAFLASYGTDEVLVERGALRDPERAEALLAASDWHRASRQGSVDVYRPTLPPPPAEFLAREREEYFRAKRRDTLSRRERMNVCAIRRIEALIGLHPAFVWAIYRRYATLPLPIEGVVCGRK
jgi:hypothetical protein